MSSVRTADVWIAPEKAHALFGSTTNNTVTFESGASIWVPACPDEHMLRGCRYTATGTQLQLQQLAAKLIDQALGPAAIEADADVKQWCYLNEQDEQFGPFSGRQLGRFNASGVWQQDFPICHAPAAVWLPIWLVLVLLGLPAAAPARQATAATDAPPPNGQQSSGGRATAGASRHSTGAAEAAAAAAAAAAAGREASSATVAHAGDAVMSDSEEAAAALLAQVALLRQDTAYIEELSRAVDMDIDEADGWQQQQQQTGDLSELPATQLSTLHGGFGSSSTSSTAQQQQQQQLVLVLDTNVLLDARGLALLQQLEGLQESCCVWLQLLLLLPWTVLVELDRLKSRHDASGHDGLSVAGQARAALRHLQAAMAQSSRHSHMYRAQSIQEFRDAARQHSLGEGDRDLVADDRILQCAMHAQQQQQQQARGNAAAGLVLLTNDLVLQLKAKANSVPTASLKQLTGVPAAQQPQQQQQVHTVLSKLMQVAGMNPTHSSSALASPAAATASTAAAAAAAAAQQPGLHQLDEQLLQQQQQQQQGSQSAADIAAAALGLIRRLRRELADKVEAVLREEFEEVWLDVVCRKPPWSDGDFLAVLHKHWRSAMQGHLVSSARRSSRQLEDVLDPPAQAQPFPVSFEREEDAWQRLLARQQAQLIAQLENTAVHSDDDTPSTSDDKYDIYEMAAKYESAAAWLEDEGVLVSSDDIDVIPDSDSEYEELVEVA
ncbi:hypothetical protein OEZ86_014259 [Tetradesmus obliquus]|nr:hypothetical protein OEZ86_014259 [Tetradesmus obliquus]